MLILLDLDGTLINTVHPTWKPYKDGQVSIDGFLDQVPLVSGVKEFIQSRRDKGDNLVVVSDSHHRYVNPICKILDLECVSLADKPNTNALNRFLESHLDYKCQLKEGDTFFIGDTKLDIEIGRKIGAKTIWFLPYQITDDIRDERDGVGCEMASLKMGPTYTAKTFKEIETILNSPFENLYSLEAAFVGSQSYKSIKLNTNKYKDNSYAYIRCLARQEQGECDKYGCADKYTMMSHPNRSRELIETLANNISSYINQDAIKQVGWDYFTYVTDKQSSMPANKMKEIFDLVDTGIKKVRLFNWTNDVQGSLRNRNEYKERQEFLKENLLIECSKLITTDISGEPAGQAETLNGKNIIILDDQLTTGATAWHIIDQLKKKGAKNVLFIAMFQMTLLVSSDVSCPICGKHMFIKIRKSDGHRFYSCIPPKFKGDGCGHIIDIPNQ